MPDKYRFLLCEDKRALREIGTWGRNVISDEWNQKENEAMIRANVLMVRISDDGLRQAVEKLKSQCAEMGLVRSEKEGDILMQRISGMLVETNAKIGELLRSTY